MPEFSVQVSTMSAESFLRTFASRLFLDRQLEFWLRKLDPTFARREVRARITGIVVETSETKTFVLKPGRQWAGFTAGQYVTLDVEIDGVRTRRCYSISSAADAGRSLTITVKRAEGGRVSSWLHDQAKVGDVVTIGAAAGDFVLPDPLPAKLGSFARLMRNRFYFDEFYEATVIRFHDFLARVAAGIDRYLIEGFGTGLVREGTDLTGRMLRQLQTGNLQTYAVVLGLGVAVVLYLALK